MRFDPELSICGLLGVNLCRESRQNTPRCLTERTRTLLSDGRPLQSQRRSHFSSACQLGISTTASAAGPKSPPPPPPDSSANLGGPPALPFKQRTSLTTQRRPPAFLAGHMALDARPRSEYRGVPTFQPDGRFVGGISCGLSCQRGMITGRDRWIIHL